MKAIMRCLVGVAVAAAALPGTARAQSASSKPSLSDIRAQWPQETIFASALCQRALDDTGAGPGPYTHTQKGWITQQYKVDPKTFVPDLNTLMEKSDEVILAGLDGNGAVLLSPSGKSVATYNEVRVVRSWKGPHHAGDTLVFGVPAGSLPCETTTPGIFTRRFDVEGPYLSRPNLFVLFLRQTKGEETKLVQGLFPAAGEGVQGIFQIPVPVPPDISAEDYCAGIGDVNVKNCDALMQTSQSPVMVFPYADDPLVKKYSGLPASDFLQEIQSVAAAQGLAEEPSQR
jgi:hypothetical protein